MWPRIGPRWSDAPFSHERLLLGSFSGDGPSLWPSQSTGRLNLKKVWVKSLIASLQKGSCVGSSPHSFSLLNHKERPYFWSTLPGERGTTHLRYRVSLHKGNKICSKRTDWFSISPSLSWLHIGISWVVLRNCCFPGHTHTYLGMRPRHEGLSSQMIPVYSCIAHKRLLATPNS